MIARLLRDTWRRHQDRIAAERFDTPEAWQASAYMAGVEAFTGPVIDLTDRSPLVVPVPDQLPVLAAGWVYDLTIVATIDGLEGVRHIGPCLVERVLRDRLVLLPADGFVFELHRAAIVGAEPLGATA